MLVIWRLYPHSLSEIITVEQERITSIACTASISNVDNYGKANIDNYSM